MTTPVTQGERATVEAAAWLARLQRDDVAADDAAEFDAWLAASPEHAPAYRSALMVWHAYETSARAVLTELEPDTAPSNVRPLRRPGVVRRVWIVGGGAALAAALALAVAPGLVMESAATQTFATGKGQHRHVVLADGSSIDLNAESRLTVTLAKAERKVVLGEGEAIFDVAHDTARPFTVAAGDHLVRVVGTQFDVRNRSGDLTVTVARGKVQVRPMDAPAGSGVFLTPGERLAVAAGGPEVLKAVDPQETFSWRSGRMVYRDQPLSEVVADLNRQFTTQIEIGDPSLASLPITGVIVLDDPHAVTQRLSLMLPVRSVPSDGGLKLLRK